MAMRDDVQTQMIAAGLPGSAVDAFLASVTAAGYNLTPTGGGSPVGATTSVPGCTLENVPGMPGWFVVTVEYTTGKFCKVLRVPNGSGGFFHTAIGQPLTSGGASS